MPIEKTLEVAITTTVRPDLLALTLESFNLGVFRHFNAVNITANLDPLYSQTSGSLEKCEALLKFYDSAKKPMLIKPTTANFNRAVHSVWSSILKKSIHCKYFLHLEDDWFLCQDVNIWNVENDLARNDVDSVRLSLKTHLRAGTESRFSLNPSFIKTNLAYRALENWQFDGDPEKMISTFTNGKTILYSPRARYMATVQDIGTYWRKSRMIEKSYSLDHGVLVSTWREIEAKKLTERLKRSGHKLKYLKTIFKAKIHLKLRKWIHEIYPHIERAKH